MTVLTDKPLRQAMSNPEAAGRLALWAIELSEFDIQYRPRTAVKGQVVADFIAEFTNGEDRGAKESPQWSIHVDGSSNRQAGEAGIVLQSPEGDTVECMVRLEFPTTNNEAEYEALIAGLDLVKAAGAEKVIVYCDSQVIVNQISGEYECKGERMKKYLDQARRRMNKLKVKIIQIPRGENEQADGLAKAASAEHMATISNTLSFTQLSPLINAVDGQELGPQNDWTTPLTSFLKNGILPNEKEAARKLKVQAARFVLIRDVLYKRCFSRPYLRCLGPEEADYVIREVHEGICGNHSGSRSLVHKLVRTGYFWPIMQKDAKAYVKACDKCQRFSNVIRQPPEELTPMTAPWPFAQWGLDIMGPFPTAIRQLKFLIVGIDYFTKFGIPRILVLDNGKQFDNDSFRNFCSQLGVRNHYSSPAHPQANGQVEVINRSLLKIIKTRLEGAKSIWAEELPSILWAYRTIARTPTGETPFRLTYGNEAVIPAEVSLTSYRVHNHDEKRNDEAIRLQLDLMDEVRMAAEQRLARYQDRMAKHYNSRVRHRDFQVGDLVLRKVMGATRDPTQESSAQIGKDPTELRHGKGRAPTI
ncbi:uncharacterized protein LOC136070035 [Quercus suber]|uniref:uncharacterized protein LOC136070035 n=1 Tax=Quercus suber TaxID=58331 RepID=UPI0032DF4DE7